MVPWAAAAIVGCIWTAITRYTLSGFSPIAVAIGAGAVLLAAPLPKWARITLGLLLGIGLRCLAAASLSGPLVEGDSPFNLQLAHNLLAGNGLTAFDADYGVMKGVYPPAYVLALAATQALGGTELWLNTVIDIAASAALYRLSRGDDRVAVAYFLFPSVLLASILPIKECLAVALMLFSMCLVERPITFGAVAALVALTQPVWAPVPIVALVILRRETGALVRAAVAAAAVMLPWWIRNAFVFHQFVPLTTSAGFSLWVAEFGTFRPAHVATTNEVALSAATARVALAAIWNDPVDYLIRVAWTAAHSLALNFEVADTIGLNRGSWVASSAIACNAAWAGLLAWCASKSAQIDKRWMAFAAGWLVGVALNIWLEFAPRHCAFAIPMLLLWASAQGRAPLLAIRGRRRAVPANISGGRTSLPAG
jgi:hypothetical protein